MLERHLHSQIDGKLQPPNALTGLISDTIRQVGPMRFDDWMRLALYHPVHGYYARGSADPGRKGDFFTSVSVGSLFGELLAARIASWLHQLSERHPQKPLLLVEAGAHSGQLAADVVREFKAGNHPWLEKLELHFIEPLPQLQSRQALKLKSSGIKAFWHSSIESLRTFRRNVVGVFYSNELLDAFPVVRLVWDSTARRWIEMRVSLEDQRLVWRRGDTFNAVQDCGHDAPGFRRTIGNRLHETGDQLGSVLPDGFIVDFSQEAEDWWRSLSGLFYEGAYLAFDYGLPVDLVIDPVRHAGTLRGYRAHRMSENVLDEPGFQDLTAHVNWESIRSVGESTGLHTTLFENQGPFFVRIAGQAGWYDGESRLKESARARQFQTLVHPDQLGTRFQVLVQTRGELRA